MIRLRAIESTRARESMDAFNLSRPVTVPPAWAGPIRCRWRRQCGRSCGGPSRGGSPAAPPADRGVIRSGPLRPLA